MAMVCPQCGNSYEQRLQCQLCGVRLVFHDARRVAGRSMPASIRWRQTAWGRVVIGLFIAQGLLYALRQLLTGALLGLQGEGSPQQTWGTPAGLILLQVLQLATLLIGSVFAGGGQRNGLLLGTIVGACNAVLTLLLQPGPGRAVSAVEMYGQPLLQAAFGALGGGLGCFFWQPLPESEPHAPGAGAGKPVGPRRPRLLAGPIAWVRVGIGIAIAVTGTLWAAALFDMAIDASDGKLATTDEMQDRVIIWEIKTLALLLGGALAGANTSNGIKQGLAVGLGTTVILVGIEASRYPNWLEAAALTLVGTFTLALAGGWFGGQLFPPVVRLKRKGRLDPAM
jgi:hypothetical protein